MKTFKEQTAEVLFNAEYDWSGTHPHVTNSEAADKACEVSADTILMVLAKYEAGAIEQRVESAFGEVTPELAAKFLADEVCQEQARINGDGEAAGMSTTTFSIA